MISKDNSRAQIQLLPDGRRLHLHDGPIDVILEAFGETDQIRHACRAAANRFVTVLDELCAELPLLRRPSSREGLHPTGRIAHRMVAAVSPYASHTFITPMAAVAGAVAEELLAVMVSSAKVSKAFVNDGGDIALYLTASEKFSVGMIQYPDRPVNHLNNLPDLFGTTTIDFSQPIRGIATSGWRGRSFSLGIADAVTVLADTAAMADAAATIVANAVDLPGHSVIQRVPACELAPDSDLGDRPVTQSVGALTTSEVHEALQAGIIVAESLRQCGLIHAAALTLRGETQVIGATESLRCQQDSALDGRMVHA
jgi:ApbE superfamily uncharacterized protein (UPF0280 family)